MLVKKMDIGPEIIGTRGLAGEIPAGDLQETSRTYLPTWKIFFALSGQLTRGRGKEHPTPRESRYSNLSFHPKPDVRNCS